MRRAHRLFALAAIAALLLAACGDDDASDAAAEGAERPTVVATTSILGDVLENLSGDQFDVITIMPSGADPHSFQASAQQANQMREADALIVNGADFEEALLDVIEASTADGVPTFAAISAVDAIEYGHEDRDHKAEEGHDDHGDDDHEAEEGHEDHDHDHDGEDPHFFTDPVRMAESADAMAEFLVDVLEEIDAGALRAAADAYIEELEALDAEVAELLDEVSDEDRVLVTNHEVFGYFALRYDFEVVGTVIPAGSTADGASAGELAELAEVVESLGIHAIFADTSASDSLVQTLAAEVGHDVAVVALFTESLGDAGSGGETYLDMVRTNAERIAAALTD